MSAPSLRIYVVQHDPIDGEEGTPLVRMTGRLLPLWEGTEAPSAYASDLEGIEAQLELQIEELLATDPADLQRFLWSESLHIRTVDVSVRPQSANKKRLVIGKQEIPLHITFAWCKLPQGGYRVMLPRFGWWYVLEDLDMASEVLRQSVSSAMMGAEARSIYEFRSEGRESIVEWRPKLLGKRRHPQTTVDTTTQFPVLHQVAEELVGGARRGRHGIVVGEPNLAAQLGRVMATPPSSLLLVGPAGVGKSTWVRRLARHLAQSDSANTPRIWATSADRIVAGMYYLGMWEQRCLDMMSELAGEGDYLWVDRLMPLLQERSGRSSIVDLFMPALISGEASLITECHPAELDRLQTHHPGLATLFHPVRFTPTASTHMPGLVRDYLARKSRQLEIDRNGLRRLVQHLDFFQRDVAFPGKAFRFIDWLVQTNTVEDDSKIADDAKIERRVLRSDDVSLAYSRATGLPLDLIADDRVAGPEQIADRLREGVVGQEDACSTCARVLARFKAGLDDPDRPVGSLLFVGPTGVGKTEMAKQLARYMFGNADRMIRVDMSEFMLPGSGQRLLSVGPGVRSLAERVRQQPLSLVLFDELEKADHEVFDLMLAILGEGRLTDAEGRLVDFRMTMICMTSNLGVEDRESSGFGGSDDDEQGKHYLRAVRRTFRPEFFNRIDHVVPFRRLSTADIRRIVDLELDKMQLRGGLRRRAIRLRVSPAARDKLAERGFHPARGARPLQRVIEEQVLAQLAVLMAASPTLRDTTIDVLSNEEPGTNSPRIALPD